MPTRLLLTRTSERIFSSSRRANTLSVGRRRDLSTQGIAAVKKLQRVLEDYRKENCTQELPSRVKKEILQEAQTEGFVDQRGLNQVLVNIHKKDQISGNDLNLIFREHGGKEKAKISVAEMMKIL